MLSGVRVDGVVDVVGTIEVAVLREVGTLPEVPAPATKLTLSVASAGCR